MAGRWRTRRRRFLCAARPSPTWRPARWNLLAWEAPRLNEHAAPFWAGVPMFEGRALDVGEFTGHALFRVVVRSRSDVLESAASRRRSHPQGDAGPQGGADWNDGRRSLRPGAKRARGRGSGRWVPPQQADPSRELGRRLLCSVAAWRDRRRQIAEIGRREGRNSRRRPKREREHRAGVENGRRLARRRLRAQGPTGTRALGGPRSLKAADLNLSLVRNENSKWRS